MTVNCYMELLPEIQPIHKARLSPGSVGEDQVLRTEDTGVGLACGFMATGWEAETVWASLVLNGLGVSILGSSMEPGGAGVGPERGSAAACPELGAIGTTWGNRYLLRFPSSLPPDVGFP